MKVSTLLLRINELNDKREIGQKVLAFLTGDTKAIILLKKYLKQYAKQPDLDVKYNDFVRYSIKINSPFKKNFLKSNTPEANLFRQWREEKIIQPRDIPTSSEPLPIHIIEAELLTPITHGMNNKQIQQRLGVLLHNTKSLKADCTYLDKTKEINHLEKELAELIEMYEDIAGIEDLTNETHGPLDQYIDKVAEVSQASEINQTPQIRRF